MRALEFRAWDSIEERYYYWRIEDCFSVGVHAGCMEKFTFEQSTGLKDKNGKQIYEGDIVRYGRRLRGIVPPESRTEIVSWQSGDEEYYPCCTTSGFSLPYSEDGYEVIGNIHESNMEELCQKG